MVTPSKTSSDDWLTVSEWQAAHHHRSADFIYGHTHTVRKKCVHLIPFEFSNRIFWFCPLCVDMYVTLWQHWASIELNTFAQHACFYFMFFFAVFIVCYHQLNQMTKSLDSFILVWNRVAISSTLKLSSLCFYVTHTHISTCDDRVHTHTTTPILYTFCLLQS